MLWCLNSDGEPSVAFGKYSRRHYTTTYVNEILEERLEQVYLPAIRSFRNYPWQNTANYSPHNSEYNKRHKRRHLRRKLHFNDSK